MNKSWRPTTRHPKTFLRHSKKGVFCHGPPLFCELLSYKYRDGLPASPQAAVTSAQTSASLHALHPTPIESRNPEGGHKAGSLRSFQLCVSRVAGLVPIGAPAAGRSSGPLRRGLAQGSAKQHLHLCPPKIRKHPETGRRRGRRAGHGGRVCRPTASHDPNRRCLGFRLLFRSFADRWAAWGFGGVYDRVI